MIIIIFISQKENGKPFNKQMQRNIRHATPTHTQAVRERIQTYIQHELPGLHLFFEKQTYTSKEERIRKLYI